MSVMGYVAQGTCAEHKYLCNTCISHDMNFHALSESYHIPNRDLVIDRMDWFHLERGYLSCLANICCGVNEP